MSEAGGGTCSLAIILLRVTIGGATYIENEDSLCALQEHRWPCGPSLAELI